MILISCFVTIVIIAFARFVRVAIDKYVEIEQEDTHDVAHDVNWVDSLLNKILNEDQIIS